MIPQTGTPNDYYRAWAKMMVTIWMDKIAKLKIRDTGALFASFRFAVESEANGDINKIVFSFLYYGRMVDMGVGRGITLADVGKDGARKPRQWYNKSWYHSVVVLTEKRARIDRISYQTIISEALNF